MITFNFGFSSTHLININFLYDKDVLPIHILSFSSKSNTSKTKYPATAIPNPKEPPTITDVAKCIYVNKVDTISKTNLT